MPANVRAIACTSWLPAGPTTPRTFAFDLSWTERVEACFASSCVSDSTNLNFVLLSRLNFASAYFANLSCSCPIDAAGPVNGPIMAIEAFEHETSCAACAAGAAGAAAFRADAATTTASAIAAARAASANPLLTIIPPCDDVAGEPGGFRGFDARPSEHTNVVPAGKAAIVIRDSPRTQTRDPVRRG